MKEQKRIKTMSNIIVFRFTGFAAIMMVVFVITSCRQKSNSQVLSDGLTTIKVNPLKTNTLEEFISKVESVWFLPLETNNDNPIDGVGRIWFTKDEILLLSGKFIFQKYDSNGKFLLKKEKDGKGKGELITIRDFSPGPNGTFFILSFKKYFHFDREGNLIGEYLINMPFESYNPNQFYIPNESVEIYSSSILSPKRLNDQEQYSLCLVNKKPLSYKMALRRPTANISDNCFNQCNSTLLINPVIGNDTIYSFDGKELVPLYYIDFGKNKVDIKELPSDYASPGSAFEYAASNEKCLRIYGTLMDDNWLMFSYFFNKSYYTALCHKKNGKTLIIELNPENTKHPLFKTAPLAVYNNEFVFSLQAYVITEMLQSNTLDFKFLSEARHQEIIDQLKQVKETDNPVLMFVKMKPE